MLLIFKLGFRGRGKITSAEVWPKAGLLWPGGGTKMGDGGKKGTGEGREELVGAGGFRWCGEWQERKESIGHGGNLS